MSQNNLEQLKEKVKRGDPEAYFQVGHRFYTARNYFEAAKWLCEAEKKNYVHATLLLAQMYEDGIGLEQNYNNAIERYRGLESRYPVARYRLGLMYEEGRGVEKNYCEAIERYRQIELKYPQAQYRLGLMYEEGRGVEKNKAKARDLYSKASKGDIRLAREALKRLSSSTAETQNTEGAVANLASVPPATQEASVTAAASELSEAESQTSGQIHFQPEQQPSSTTTESAQPQSISSDPGSLPTVGDKQAVHDAGECRDQETTSSSTIETQNTEDAIANIASLPSATQEASVAAASEISGAESQTSEQIHSQPEQQPDVSTTASAQPQSMSSEPGSLPAVGDEQAVHDAGECCNQEVKTAIEKLGVINLPQEPSRDDSPLGATGIEVVREEPVKTPETSVTGTQWECREPPEGANWPKAHQHHKADRGAGLFLARRRGRSHEHDAKFCDDDGDFWRHPSGWTVLAVADGAGSAEYSREGSRIAVATVLEEFERWFTPEKVTECNACLQDWESSHGAFHQLFYLQFFEICKKAIAKIKALAEQNNVKERQFATTLLVTVSKTVAGKTYLASLWIGDGAMVAYRPEASRLLGSADSGAFVGQTRFLDASYLQQHYPSSVSIAAIEQAEALILMTDGVSDPKFKSDADLGDPRCWDQLWQELEPELTKDNPEQALLEWLHFFERGYHDDRTLLISLVQADKEQK